MGLTREIVARAMKDASFRKKLLQDPKGTIHKELGVNLPEGITVRVHEDSPTVMNLVLPAALDISADRDLTDAELEAVAGGALTGTTFGKYTACCTVKPIGH